MPAQDRPANVTDWHFIYCQFAPGTKLTIFYDLEKGEKDREAAWLHAELLQGWPALQPKILPAEEDEEK
ncbi:MAG: hypothetical protein LUG84_06210 [Akkermansiaceae bacterium]|nr:hypothetical protein [Akkermansiaceae bacterium]